MFLQRTPFFRYWILGWAIFLFLGTAWAAPRTFTIAEEAIIERNEALLAVAEQDPALVKRILDAMAARNRKGTQREIPSGPQARPKDIETGPAAPFDEQMVLDPSQNPDLVIFQRGSPEAAFQLFQLLKKAGARK